MNFNVANPYRSPTTKSGSPPDAPRPHRRSSLLRGLFCAFPWAALGYAIPFAVNLAVIVIRFFTENSPFPLSFHLRDNIHAWTMPSVGCAFVFGLAAFLNDAPARSMGIVRAISLVALVLIGAGILLILIWPPTGRPDPWEWHRTITAFSFPLLYTLVHTGLRLKLPIQSLES